MRAIDADKLKRKAQECATEAWKMNLTARIETVLNQFIDWIDKAPTVEPEIVRCKDCKYYRKYGYVNGKPKFLPKCTFNSIYVNADDFCSRAERRTDD